MANLITGDTAIDFTLPATDNKTYSGHEALTDATALVIVFTSNLCPYAQAWEDRINAIARDYAVQDVHVLAINSNDDTKYPGENMENMARRAIEKDFVFPYLRDDNQLVASAYGAERTPELFIFDASAKLRYHGAPDDNYEDEAAVQHNYARDALDAIITNNEVPIAETQPIGCTIKWKA